MNRRGRCRRFRALICRLWGQRAVAGHTGFCVAYLDCFLIHLSMDCFGRLSGKGDDGMALSGFAAKSHLSTSGIFGQGVVEKT